MVRPFGTFVVTLGVLAFAGAPAWAQAQKGRGGFGFGMGGAGMILRAENVQKDLKLSDDQVGKIQETLGSVMEKHRDDFAAIRELPQEERMPKIVSLNKEVTDEIKKGLSMTPEQSKRYDQISLQARGLMAFADPTVAEKLKLTDDQKGQIREIATSSRGPGPGAFGKDASDDERREAMKKFRETQQENVKKAIALLTDDQKKEWKELTGEPIEIQIPFGRRPNN